MACIRSGNRLDVADVCRQRNLAEVSRALIAKNPKMAVAVDERSVRIAVSIQIGPHKAAHAGDSAERRSYGEGPIPVVTQHLRLAGLGAEHKIQVAVGLNIDRPTLRCSGRSKPPEAT